MKTHILPALKLSVLLAFLLTVIYTSGIWGIAQFSSHKGNGNIILVGQSFTVDKYFWSRPSAVNYNAAGSGGSNKGPSNQVYLAEVQSRIDTFWVHHPYLLKKDIPAEMVTASASGLDPHISPRAAFIQVKRIANTRNIADAKVEQLLKSKIEGPLFSFLGPSTVNVLELNIELDKL